MAQPWNVKLFSCFDDIPTCLTGACCPCYLFSTNATHTSDMNQWLLCLGYCALSPCMACGVLHYPHRKKLRNDYNLVEEPNDFVASVILSVCANCQEAREIQQRGSMKRSSSYKPR